MMYWSIWEAQMSWQAAPRGLAAEMALMGWVCSLRVVWVLRSAAGAAHTLSAVCSLPPP